MEFYSTYVANGESVVDIAMREYGHVDGIFYLYEDNPGKFSNLTDTVATGTLLVIRKDPSDIDLKKVSYVRIGKELKEVKIVKDPSELYDIYLFDFPAGADFTYAVYQVTKSVKLLSAEVLDGSANFSSYTVKKNGTVTALPFNAADGDVIAVELTGWNGNHVQIKITAAPVQTTKTIYSYDNGGDGRYLFVLNYVDQTVSVIDTNTHTVTTTISLPAGKSFASCLYRSIDKSGWVFGTSWYAKIDCNPASGTFCTVIANGTATVGSNQSGCAYDYVNDIIYLASGSNTLHKFTPATLLGSSIASINGYVPAWGSAMSYLVALKAIYIGDPQSGQIIVSTETDLPIYGFGATLLQGQMQYNHKNGKIYHVGGGQVIVRQANPIKQLASISNTHANRSGMALVPALNKAIAASAFTNSVAIINTATDTNIASVAKTTPATNEAGSRTVLYSPFSDRVYVQGLANAGQVTGVDRVHIFNPNTNAYQGYVTVGNMDALNSHNYWGHQMFLNTLIP